MTGGRVSIRSLTDLWRCHECGAVVFDVDSYLHREWHSKLKSDLEQVWQALEEIE